MKMTDCKREKREKKKETLCVNNHGHQAPPEYKPGRPMSLVESGQIERIGYKSSHFEIQKLVLYASNQKRIQLMSSCDGPGARRGGPSTEYPAPISAWDSELNPSTYSNQSLSSVPAHLQSGQECSLERHEMWS